MDEWKREQVEQSRRQLVRRMTQKERFAAELAERERREETPAPEDDKTRESLL